MSEVWARKGEFINSILVLAVSFGDLQFEEVELNGVAGPMFDKAVEAATQDTADDDQRDDYIKAALLYGAPVEDLAPDGTFGEEWEKVVALCKEPVVVDHTAENATLPLAFDGQPLSCGDTVTKQFLFWRAAATLAC